MFVSDASQYACGWAGRNTDAAASETADMSRGGDLRFPFVSMSIFRAEGATLWGEKAEEAYLLVLGRAQALPIIPGVELI